MPRGRDEPLTIDIHLRRDGIVRLAALLVCLNLLFLAGTWLRAAAGSPGGLPGYVLRQLDVRSEQNIAAWYSALVLLGAAAAFALAFLSARRATAGAAWRPLDWGWIVIALTFVVLSLDEVAGVHEATPQAVRNPFEGRLDDWVGSLAVPIVVVALAFGTFAWLRVRRSPVAFALFGLGLLLLITVPVQEQLQNWMRVRYGGRPVLLALLEEGAEIFGAVGFLASGLLHALGGRDAIRLSMTVPVRLAAVMAAAAPVALGCGLLAVEVGLPALGVRLVDGTPSGWFGGCGALLAGVAALVVWRRRRRAPDGAAWFVAGALALLVATDLGTGRALTEQLWPGSPRRQLAVRAVLGAWLLVAVGTIWLHTAPAVRWAVLAWGLAAAAAIAALPGSTWLVLGGTGCMLAASLAERGLAAPASAGGPALAQRPASRLPLER